MLKKFVPLLILLLAAALNTFSLARYERFHPDEAFFMTFARNAAVNGDWWLSGALDKPPLTMYINALSLKFIAVDTDANGIFQLNVYKGEFAGRVPGVLIGVLLVAVIMALTKALYHDNAVAWRAGLLAALSPYVIAFSPTAFTDMPMLLFGTAALYAAAKHKPAWSGMWFILALACKPQAVYLLPVILAWQHGSMSAVSIRRSFGRSVLRPYSLVVIGGLILFGWDTARPGDSVFALGAVNNAPETFFAPPDMWLSRTGLWLSYGQYLGGDTITTGVMIILAVLGGRDVSRPYNRVLFIWLIGYSGFHIITAINIYDRYLLLTIPAFVLLVAQSITATRSKHKNLIFASVCLCVCVLNFLAVVPVGSDRGDYAGIDELANYLNVKPVATVIYDHWLGWETGYYMGQWTDKRRVYYPTPEALAIGALALYETGRRYFIAPEDADVTPWLAALNSIGFEGQLETQIARFRVYALIPPS